ncbi:MAG: hypothetical protein QW156_04920, partial [Candidatus Aenigmatarchaeota archaeon]
MEINCPNCSSTNIIKKGIRKEKLKQTQLYFCKNCNKTFTLTKIKKTKYPEKIILHAITFYNLGYSRKEVSKLIAKKFHIKIPERTISYWVKKYSKICTFSKIRKQSLELYEKEDLIFSQKLFHK